MAVSRNMLNIFMLVHVSTRPVLTCGAEKWSQKLQFHQWPLEAHSQMSHLPTDSRVKMQHYSRNEHINSLLLETVSFWPFWQLYCFFSFLPHLLKLSWGLKSGRVHFEWQEVNVRQAAAGLCLWFTSSGVCSHMWRLPVQKTQRSDDQNQTTGYIL